MPGGRTFLANHAITRASALGSSFNSTDCFEPCFRAAVTIAGPVRATSFAFDCRGRFDGAADLIPRLPQAYARHPPPVDPSSRDPRLEMQEGMEITGEKLET